MLKTPYLLMLCFSAPVIATAAPGAAVVIAAPNANAGEKGTALWTTPMRIRNYTTDFTINFPEPMVDEAEVGNKVPPCNEQGEGGYYRVDGPATVEVTWQSTSSIRVSQKSSPRHVLSRFIVPEGATALSGKKMGGMAVCIGDRFGVLPNRTQSTLNEDATTTFFSAHGEKDEEFLRQAIPHAYLKAKYYDKRDAQENPHIPVAIRPATYGDALANEEQFGLLIEDDLTDADKEILRAKDPSTELPGVWCVDFPVYEDKTAAMELYLPGLGEYSEITGGYTDYKLYTFAYNHFYASLRDERTDVGEYRLDFYFSQPVAGDIRDMFRNAGWQAAAQRRNPLEDMKWDESRQAFIYNMDEGEVILTLDEEASLAEVQDVKLPGGGTVRGTKHLHMKLKTPVPGIVVGTMKPITSVHGKVWQKPDGSDRFLSNIYESRMSRLIVPQRPSLRTEMLVSGLRGEGKRTIYCNTEHVTEVKARVYRIEGSGDATPRLLQGYEELYRHANHLNRPITGFIESYWTPYQESKSSIGVPSILIPGRPAKAETVLTPDKDGRCSLDPTTLFPGKNPHATYFVELQADTAPEADDGKYVLNQGVVQVTDLGVMWKLSAGRIFAYVHRLSDGKQVPAATVHLLDGTGMEIGRLEAKDGIAEGAMPEGVRFLQVESGDDIYTTKISNRRDLMEQATGDEYSRLSRGLNPAEIVELQHCVFTDRSLYRKGETAHIKGILRFLQGDTLSIPEVESISAEASFPGGPNQKVEVKCEPDGTFSLDLPIDESWYGYGEVAFEITYKGDADGTTPDMQAAKKAGVEDPGFFTQENRHINIEIPVQDYRRNEFEIASGMDIHADKGSVTLTAEAHDFNTAPVANGTVEWGLGVERINFYPAKFKDYRFGDQKENDGGYFSAYYGSGYVGDIESKHVGRDGALDENGKGEMEFTLPEMEHPGRYRLSSTVSITNGNEQTLTSTRYAELEGSGVYAGIKGTDKLVKAGEPIRLEALLVTPEGEAWGGAPMPATVKVKRTVFNPYRYGTKLRSAIRNEKEEEEYPAQQISVGGTPASFEVPTSSAGIYDIEIEGKDAEGKPYYTSVRKYVWGADISPWEYHNGAELELTANKDVYKVGETAKILVQTPVDAELLVTVERDGVQRHYNRSVTVANPVLEVPIEAEDAPYVRVSVFLVQGADSRGKDGEPVIKNAFTDLHVDMPEKRLAISLDTPQQALTPAEECTVGGIVKDAEGKPVANAEIALYAEDEGTLQVMGYTNPEPYDDFYGTRAIGVATFNTLGQLLGDFSYPYDFGNKGIFVGGGDCGGSNAPGANPTTDNGVRKDFNPCAIWLGRVTTDAQGRFSATYANPDTLTRYRVIAVASAGADKFGSAQSSYLVAKPVMLEPSEPLTATEGDCVDVPVTVTMLPDLLPAGCPKEMTWDVTLEAENATVPAATRSVTLGGKVPATIHFPVTMKEAGPVTLTWRVAPQTVRPGMEKLKDAVQLEFDVVPPTPHLRLPMFSELKPGRTLAPATLPSEELRPTSKTELLVSLSPLSGAAQGVDYLFSYPYGCSEQLSSTLLPWLMADTLEKWVDVRFPEGQSPAKVERKTVRELMDRQLGNGGFRYWNHGNEASEFTPYVCLALSYSEYAKTCAGAMEEAQDYLKKTLKEDKEANLLGLLALARMDELAAVQLIMDIPGTREKWTPADRVLFACSALECKERLGDAVEAGSPFMIQLEKAVAEAQKALKGNKDLYNGRHSFATPPSDALSLLFDIKTGKAGTDMVPAMRKYVMESMSHPHLYTTWNNAWACIVIHEFCKAYAQGIQLSPVDVNGQTVEPGKPMRLKGMLKDMPALTLKGKCPVYISGLTEGYTVAPQKIAAVDHGFLVERHYEKLMPDNTWQPTATFEVGDIVRVTFTAAVTNKEGGAYTVAEDRLPAGFEAVNPELDSQRLPDFVMKNPESCWSASRFVDHTEYHKDSVQFFATDFYGAPRLEATYIARVVKSGRMTAPAAKVERMYSPDVYGLSIPQEFTVKPRK